MKRSAKLSRGEPLDRRSELKRSTRLRVLGRRGHEARKAMAAVRAEVLERAGWRCERCGLAANAVGPLHLHHRKTRAQGGGHEASNLVALCRVCHRDVHAGAADAHRWIVTRKGAA